MLQISVISCALLPFSFFYFYPPILLGYLEIGQRAKNQKNQSADQPMLQLSTICTKMYCNCTDREYFFFFFLFFAADIFTCTISILFIHCKQTNRHICSHITYFLQFLMYSLETAKELRNVFHFSPFLILFL